MPTYQVTPLIRIHVVLAYIALVVRSVPEFLFSGPTLDDLGTSQLGVDNTEEEYGYITWNDDDDQPTWSEILEHYVAAWNWGYAETGIRVVEKINYAAAVLEPIYETELPNLHTDLSDLETEVAGKANTTHSHIISDITGLQTALDGKVPTTRTVNGHALSGNINVTRSDLSFASAATHIADSATNAATDAATNASTTQQSNLPTNYNTLSGLLGIANGLNDANNQQNILEAKHVDLATKVNSNATKQNAGFTILNALATKYNLSLDILENNGLMAA